jgi:hypothetical protein
MESAAAGCISPSAEDIAKAESLIDNGARTEANAAAIAAVQRTASASYERRNAMVGFIAAQNGFQSVPLDEKTYDFITTPEGADDNMTLAQSLRIANEYASVFDVEFNLNRSAIRVRNAEGAVIVGMRAINEASLTDSEREAIKENIRSAVAFLSLWPRDFPEDIGLANISIASAGEPMGDGWGSIAARAATGTHTLYLVYDVPATPDIPAGFDTQEKLMHETEHFIDAETCESGYMDSDPAISAENNPGFHYSPVYRPLPNTPSEDATHVSEYAMTSAAEDKAETFKQYLVGAFTEMFQSPKILGKLSVILARLKHHFRGKNYAEYIVDLANLP